MTIEKVIGRTLAGAPKKLRETTLGAASAHASVDCWVAGFCVA